MSPCEPGLFAAVALGGMPLLAAFIVTLFLGVFLGVMLTYDRRPVP